MVKEKEDSMDDYYDDVENEFNEDTASYEPQTMDADTFKQRNDPQQLLERFKLQLLNAYKIKTIKIDKKGNETEIYAIRKKRGTKPKANAQGVEDIISYMEKFINSHTVQGNITTMEEFRNFMRYASNDLTMHFMVLRVEWKVDINDIDSITASSINVIELFLTRTLFNEERKSYGETFKETINREIRTKEKLNIMQKIGSFMGWK